MRNIGWTSPTLNLCCAKAAAVSRFAGLPMTRKGRRLAPPLSSEGTFSSRSGRLGFRRGSVRVAPRLERLGPPDELVEHHGRTLVQVLHLGERLALLQRSEEIIAGDVN